jgi:type II secretory pathway pseudopilin PulG
MRRRGLRSARLPITNCHSETPQCGYIMITLILALALITIALLAVVPEIKQQLARDREEEMRHRGTAYMRAIQHFYKKFGRYPARVEELENTNNLRFLRKRYKDPINRDPVTGKEKDFKFLTQQDITLNNGPLLGQTPGQGGFGGPGASGAFGGANGVQGALGGMQGGIGGLGGAQSGAVQPPANPGSQTPPSGAAGNAADDDTPNAGGSSPSNSNASSSTPGSTSSGPGSGFNGPTFGGGPIVGVASLSKEKSIRVFYDKNHYNDWLFIYAPQADVGGLLVGPVSLNGPPYPNLAGGLPGQPAGMPGQAGGLNPGLGTGASTSVGQPPSPMQPQQGPPEN